MAAFHAGTIHPQNPSDKGRPNRRGRRVNSNHEGILAAAADRQVSIVQGSVIGLGFSPELTKQIHLV
jgi:hypothetical protein